MLETPTRLRLPAKWVGSSLWAQLGDALGYEDLKVKHEWRTWRDVQRKDDAYQQSPSYRPHWFVAKYGREALDAKVAALEAERHKSLLFRDEQGFWTYSGLATRLKDMTGEPVVLGYPRPAPGLVGWHSTPHEPRWYQQRAEELLVPMGHGAVELATGLGKSLIIARLLWRLGLPGIVVAPTLSIAGQLHADLVRLFGRQHVGQFFDGKKQADKKFVVAVSKSLINLEPGTPLAEALARKAVLIGDESHLLPAETLARVVLGLLGNVPYRFFLSGTQLRSDGLDLLLEGITGDIVLRMNVRQGVDEGFLTRPRFFQFQVQSDRNYDVPDPIKMNRVHLHDNPKVYEHAGGLIRHALRAGRRPLVLVEEVPQFGRLLPFLGGVKAGFAHGGVNKDNRDSIPKAHHKSDPMALVEAFDAGELECLVGTQCIGTGTDIKTASFVVDLVGLASEVRIRQNVGRGTRVHPTKKDFIYVDYDVRNFEGLSRQAAKRARIFDDIYGPVKYLKA